MSKSTDLNYLADILERQKIFFYVIGGFGVDLLYGNITRPHQDIDIDVKEEDINKLPNILKNKGYEVVKDELPMHIRFTHKEHGDLDVYSYIVKGNVYLKYFNGTMKEYDSSYYTKVEFKDRLYRCLSVKGQKEFHEGLKLTEEQEKDMIILERVQERIKKENKKKHKLYKSNKNKIIFGVCSGLGQKFKMEPNVVRIIFVAGTVLLMGLGLIVYILLAIFLPKAED